MSRVVFRRVASVIAASVMALTLVGCGPTLDATNDADQRALEEQPDPVSQEEAAQIEGLESYVDQERSTIPTILDQYPGVYSEIAISPVNPDTVDFTYVYAEQLDPSGAAEYFDGMIPTLQALCETQIFPAMERAGVTTSQKVTYTYVNADGSEIWSHTFTSS